MIELYIIPAPICLHCSKLMLSKMMTVGQVSCHTMSCHSYIMCMTLCSSPSFSAVGGGSHNTASTSYFVLCSEMAVERSGT